MYEGLTKAKKAVLEPPYANHLDPPKVNLGGSVKITLESEGK
jgi:hypothetical protein